MAQSIRPILDSKKSYLQVALNGSLSDAARIIASLPKSDRIIVEAGTPLIKQYGEHGIRQIVEWCSERLVYGGETIAHKVTQGKKISMFDIAPYVVADLKTMDRADTEVAMAARAGARAAIALGLAPIETLNTFIESCEAHGMDAMIDMMNVEYPLAVLQKLRKIPPIIIIHRGVDEERINKEKMIPLHEIRRIKGMYDVMISIAGGDTLREVQRATFNDADIVVIWKSVYTSTSETATLVEEFLHEVK